MDLLLDVNIVVDLLANRKAFAQHAADVLDRCYNEGTRVWLYAGSVQTLEYVLAEELSRNNLESYKFSRERARLLLKEFSADKQWLTALAGEGNVFESDDPEDEQLIRALQRFAEGTILLLTRDKGMLKKCPQAIRPLDFLGLEDNRLPIDFINLKKQQDCIRPDLELRTHTVLHHGQYIMGPEVAELEEKLAAYVGVKHCITASSGTDTLLIALMALGIGLGDEVITSPFTFIATGEMIALAGAKPVFVDIDPRTYNIDPALIEAAITPRTKAIMPVSLYGQCADFDAINAIAEKHNLPVIEDGAQSFGATYKGSRSCGLSTIGSTSFFPSKPLGCYGDGGALFTDDVILATSMRQIRAHGQDRRYHHPRIGINGRMDTLQAAVLLAKLEIFDEEVAARASIGARYAELLNRDPESTIHEQRSANNNPRIITPFIEPYNTSVYAQYTVQVDSRDEVMKRLADHQSPSTNHRLPIPTAVHYPVPLHLQPVFDGLNQSEGSFPVAEAAARRVMSLPMHPYLDKDEQDVIVASLQRAVA